MWAWKVNWYLKAVKSASSNAQNSHPTLTPSAEISGEAQAGDIFVFVLMVFRAVDQVHRPPGAEVAELSLQTGVFTPQTEFIRLKNNSASLPTRPPKFLMLSFIRQ